MKRRKYRVTKQECQKAIDDLNNVCDYCGKEKVYKCEGLASKVKPKILQYHDFLLDFLNGSKVLKVNWHTPANFPSAVIMMKEITPIERMRI